MFLFWRKLANILHLYNQVLVGSTLKSLCSRCLSQVEPTVLMKYFMIIMQFYRFVNCESFTVVCYPLCKPWCFKAITISPKGMLLPSIGGVWVYNITNYISQHALGKIVSKCVRSITTGMSLPALHCAWQRPTRRCEICCDTQTYNRVTRGNCVSGRLSCAAKEGGHKQKHVAVAVRQRVCDFLQTGQILRQ